MTVFVGDASFAMKYVIHKKLVSYHSTFFKAALNGSFLEGQNNQVKLEEELPEVFNGFVHWLYTGQSPRDPSGDTYSLTEPALYFLRLYCMADRMFAPELKALAYKEVRATLCKESR